MALYKDASGQLVIATSLPVGGSVVTAAASVNLTDLAPWYRALDAGNTDWHPAKYYSGAAETAAAGTNGYSNAQIAAYKRSATLPTDNPGNVTYDFTNASITTSLGGGWYSDIPAGSGPVYVVFAPASSQDTTIGILAADWTNPPVLLFDSGTDGESSFPSFVFIRSATQPATPTGGSYASPLPTTVGWSDGIPSDNNQPLWMSKRVFSKSGGAPQDAAWSATSKVGTPSTSSKLQFSIDGTTGWHDTPSAGDEFMRSGTSTDNGATWSYAGVVRVKGEAGSSGTATRGPAHWYTSGSFWSDSVANAVVTAAGYTPMAGDQVTISGTNFAHVKKWNGSSWIDLGQVITGDLVVENSITVNKLNTNSIEVRDNSGNVLFSVNVPLDYDRIGGTNRPANGATVGADSNNLRVGTGGNLIPNSDLGVDNSTEWYVEWAQFGGAGSSAPIYDMAGIFWNPAGGHSIGFERAIPSGVASASAQGWFDLTYKKYFTVVPGERLELSAYLQCHRNTASVVAKGFKFNSATGVWTFVADLTGFGTSGEVVAANSNFAAWARHGGFFYVPSDGSVDAVRITLRGSAYLNLAANLYTWGTKFYFGRAHAGQTELSTWVLGGAGGKFSELDQINTSNIDVYMGDLAVKTIKIAGRAINGNLQGGGSATIAPSGNGVGTEICRLTVPAVPFGVRSNGVGVGLLATGMLASQSFQIVSFYFEYSIDGGSSWSSTGLTHYGSTSVSLFFNNIGPENRTISFTDFLTNSPDTSIIFRLMFKTTNSGVGASMSAGLLLFDSYK